MGSSLTIQKSLESVPAVMVQLSSLSQGMTLQRVMSLSAHHLPCKDQHHPCIHPTTAVAVHAGLTDTDPMSDLPQPQREKTTPVGIDGIRSQALYWAAWELQHASVRCYRRNRNAP